MKEECKETNDSKNWIVRHCHTLCRQAILFPSYFILLTYQSPAPHIPAGCAADPTDRRGSTAGSNRRALRK